ncbi:MAG: DUF5719 family protein [Propionibacteriaceae bacterium]|nr:DUF5719 family protein [Propionibacteriaceae bacterium]
MSENFDETPMSERLRGRRPRSRHSNNETPNGSTPESFATEPQLHTAAPQASKTVADIPVSEIADVAVSAVLPEVEDDIVDVAVPPPESIATEPSRNALWQAKSIVQAVLGTTAASRKFPPLEAFGAVILLVLGLVFVGLVSMRPQEPHDPHAVMPGADVRLVCPGFTNYPGSIVGQVRGNANYSIVGSTAAAVALQEQIAPGTAVNTPSMLVAAPEASELVARFAIQSDSYLAAANCSAPLASQYLLFPDAAGSVLQIVNPDQSDAVFNITIIGSKGEITKGDLRDAKLQSNSMREYQLSDYVSDTGPVGIRLQNTSGRLQATGLVNSVGLDMVSASRTGLSLVAAGVPALMGVQVILTNPATVRVNVSIKVMTSEGITDLAGFNSVVVEASQSKIVDVTEAIMGRSGAVLVSANNDIAASVVVTQGDDVAVIPAVPTTHLVAEPLLASIQTPATATIQASVTVELANAGERSVSVPVTLRSATEETTVPIEIAPGSFASYQVPADTLQVGLERANMVAAVLVSNQGGIAVTGLPVEVRNTGRTPLRVVVRQ